ncbi:MAG: tetraacyldisaccharide 4'-kinase [Planctomycetes bacterium]|nr:tetraacyldisaccharide 4'-kinase [Planctomycetota bacterium]
MSASKESPVEEWYLALVRGERRGLVAALLRGILWLCSWPFRLVIAVRALCFRLGVFGTTRAFVPVISIGNLTTGGTGKTPLVIALCRGLEARGERVGVLARGYGAPRDGDLNDELRLIQREVPDAILAPGKNRAVRAGQATGKGATILVLDDGFQHRRLGRDLDVVLLDATSPWGGGHLLPRGLLREPPSALRRADAVVLTRAELSSPSQLAALEETLRAKGYRGPVFRMTLNPSRLVAIGPQGSEERPLETLRDLPVVLACGIGNPRAFAATAASLGARTNLIEAFADHHAYTPADLHAIEDLAIRRAVEHVLITDKDAVKLASLLAVPRDSACTWLCLSVEATIEPREAWEALWPAGRRMEQAS